MRSRAICCCQYSTAFIVLETAVGILLNWNQSGVLGALCRLLAWRKASNPFNRLLMVWRRPLKMSKKVWQSGMPGAWPLTASSSKSLVIRDRSGFFHNLNSNSYLYYPVIVFMDKALPSSWLELRICFPALASSVCAVLESVGSIRKISYKSKPVTSACAIVGKVAMDTASKSKEKLTLDDCALIIQSTSVHTFSSTAHAGCTFRLKPKKITERRD